MKIIQRFASRLVAGTMALAVLGLASRVAAQDSDPQLTAKIIRVHGMARYSTDNQNWREAKAGDILKPGTVIQTAEKSSVDLLLGERGGGGGAPTPISYNPNAPIAAGGGGGGEGQVQNNVVRMFESSVLAIDKLSRDNATDTEETQLDLRAGRIMGNVKKLSAASKYEVKIPNGVAGIRGTTYMISSSGVVDVLSGSVVIAYVGSDGTVITKVVTAGYSWDPTTLQMNPIPAQQLAQLQAIYLELYGNTPTPPTTYTPPAPPGVSPSPINVTPSQTPPPAPTPPPPPSDG